MKKLFLNDRFILIIIFINAILIFANGFDISKSANNIIYISDNICTLLFIFELIFKIKIKGFKTYFLSNWNKFDFFLIILSIPALISFIFNIQITEFSFLLVFRVLRVFKTFRFLKFIPKIDDLIKGVHRALKTSVFVFVGFAVYIFIVGILSFYLFKSIAPQYFSDPLNSLYTTFKIFTVEGWFEVPDVITKNLSATTAFFTYLYFVFVLLTGGIFGLSLVNSIFVDAMVSDNNDDLEQKINQLSNKIDELTEQLKKSPQNKI